MRSFIRSSRSQLVAIFVVAAAAITGCSAEAADDNAAIDKESSNNDFTEGEGRPGGKGGAVVPGEAGPFGAGVTMIDIEKQLPPVVAKLRAVDPRLEILAPSFLPGTRDTKVFLSGRATPPIAGAPSPPAYTITFGLTPDCDANACSIGSITSGPSPVDFVPNGEVDGVKVQFDKGSCGASCAPPSMSWQGSASRMTLWLKGATEAQLKVLVRSALKAGPRS